MSLLQPSSSSSFAAVAAARSLALILRDLRGVAPSARLQRSSLWASSSSMSSRATFPPPPPRSAAARGDGSGGIGDPGDDMLLLYRRDPSRAFFPRSLLAFNAFHVAYWTWYAFDFTPAVNAAASSSSSADAAAATSAALATVDPSLGYVGVTLSLLMATAAQAYPKHLVSELRLTSPSAGRGGLVVKTHDLPFVTPSKAARVYDPDALKLFDGDAKTILGKCDGQLGRHRGHLALRDSSTLSSGTHLLLDVGSEDEVHRDGALLNALLPSEMVAAVRVPEEEKNGSKIKRQRRLPEEDGRGVFGDGDGLGGDETEDEWSSVGPAERRRRRALRDMRRRKGGGA